MIAVATATGRLTALLLFSDVSVHLVTFAAWLVGWLVLPVWSIQVSSALLP